MEQYENMQNRAWVNGILIGVNILFFVYLEIVGSTEDIAFMLNKGAMYAPLVIQYKEYYRIFTSMFMHFGYMHLANNMLILLVLGGYMERALGKAKYLFFYLACGVGSKVVSMLFDYMTGDFKIGTGASGAIFGVVGGLLYVIIVNKGRLEELNTKQIVVMILFSLCFGFMNAEVNNIAHVAGLFWGFLFAAVLYRKPKQEVKTEWWEAVK